LMSLLPYVEVAVVQGQEKEQELIQNTFATALIELSKKADPKVQNELKALAEKVKKPVPILGPVVLSLGLSRSVVKNYLAEDNSLKAFLLRDDIYISLVEGDISQQRFLEPDTSAITNAANTELMGGSCVDAAVHNAACDGSDWKLLQDANVGNRSQKFLTTLAKGIDEKVRAVITSACKLKDKGICSYIIHAVGPHGPHSKLAEQALDQTYKNILSFADSPYTDEKLKWGLKSSIDGNTAQDLKNDEWQGVTSIAIPTVSTGVFGYDIKDATPVAIKTVLEYLDSKPTTKLKEIRFVVWDEKGYNTIYAN
jgi:O-acetyl-ADP-ribose deacetylase